LARAAAPPPSAAAAVSRRNAATDAAIASLLARKASLDVSMALEITVMPDHQ
jgi:hypothetical protein